MGFVEVVFLGQVRKESVHQWGYEELLMKTVYFAVMPFNKVVFNRTTSVISIVIPSPTVSPNY